MWRREKTSRLAAPAIGSTLLIVLVFTVQVQAATDEYTPATGDTWSCPAPEPVLESPLGWSQYWHDPCGGGFRDSHRRFFQHRSVPASWYVTAEAVPLFRDGSDDLGARTLLSGAALPSGMGEMDSDFDLGARASIGSSLGDWYRLEVSWLGGYSWSDTAIAQTANESASISVESSLNSCELNVRRRLCIDPGQYQAGEVSFLVGLRYMQIEEDLAYTAQPSGAAALLTPGQAAVQTTNDLFGVQIGGLAQFLVYDRAWIDFEAKGAIFSNAARAESTFTVLNGPPATFEGDEDRTSFLGDLSLMFNYQFAPAWTFRAGYNSLWFTGLALGADNITTRVATPPVNLDHSGHTVYHGPSIGCVWAH